MIVFAEGGRVASGRGRGEKGLRLGIAITAPLFG